VYRIILCVYLVVSILAISSSAEGQFKREDFERADEAVVRLKPSDFPDLPSEVHTELEKRGCTIPQPFGSGGERKNVVSGRFTSAAEKDWAVLCSRNRRSAILVFHDGKSDRVDEIAGQADIECLQVVSGGREIAFSRQLAVATPKAVHRRVARRADFLRNIDHDGIEDVFLEKGSVIWFFISGKWTRLAGAD
jgi:hypothetical protein